MQHKIIDIIKNEIVLLIAFLAALISCLFVPVTNYTQYIDTNTIGILFSLMAVVAGFNENGVFNNLSEKIKQISGSTNKSAVIIILVTFFTAMFITNDVALITFVPLSILTLKSLKEKLAYVIALQTVAANLGSMLTPIGNPQNLYLFNYYEMSLKDFLSVTAPITIFSFILIVIACCFIQKKEITRISSDNSVISNKLYIVIYFLLFILCLLAIMKVVTMLTVFASVCVVLVIMEPKIFKRIDYSLLLTFVFFFIFVGNLKNIPVINNFISQTLSGHELSFSILASQIISNVPAAIMLSAFTDNADAIITGVDIGGLGTPIASLASLISMKLYFNSENSHPKRYILVFTIMNLIFILLLIGFKIWIYN